MNRFVLLALLAAMATAPFAGAQRASRPAHFGGGFAGAGFDRAGGRSSLIYPLGLFTDYSDALYRSGYPVASQPPVIILQGAAPAASEAPKAFGFPAPAQPLVIELQGDRYVRVSGDVNSGAELETVAVQTDAKVVQRPTVTAPARNISPAVTRTAAAEQLPPAVLVFRDGHREEVGEYTIADGALYAQGEYYTSGMFTKKFELKSLDLPETAKSNRSRGVIFRLPASPNEVIVRP